MSTGVRHGGILSPALFNLLRNLLIVILVALFILLVDVNEYRYNNNHSNANARRVMDEQSHLIGHSSR